MHYRFLHRKPDPLTGKPRNYLHRHPTIEVSEGLYEALRPIAKKKGYKNVNEMIARESATMLMNILLGEG